MSRIRHKGLAFAMEEEEVIVPAEPDEVLTELEEPVAEVQEQADDIDDLSTAVEDAIEDGETMEDIQDVLVESVEPTPEEGASADAPPEQGEGVSPEAAEVAEIAVEALCARLGIRSKVKAFPGLESFGATSSRNAATRIAVENIGAKLKTAWESIKKGIAELFKRVMEFLKKHLDTNARLQGAAEKLKASVEALGDKKPAQSGFESAGLAKGLVLQGKADAASTLEILAACEESIGKIAPVGQELEGFLGKLESVVDASKEKGAVAPVVATALQTIAKTVKSIKGSKESKDGENFVTTIGNLPNGKEIVVTSTISNDPDTKMVFSVREDEAEGGEVKDGQLPVLTKAEMLEILKAVQELSKSNDEARKFDGIFAGVEKKFNGLADKVIKNIGKLDNAPEIGTGLQEDIALARSAVSKVSNFYASFATRVTNASVVAGKLALGYVSASLKQYKGEAAAATEAPKQLENKA